MGSDLAAARHRAGGILLHPTSLPSNCGIGDMGAGLFRWLDWLAEAGCTLWQILPLGPTGFGDSPYQSFSAAAGNPLLIDLFQLVESGLLEAEELLPPEEIQDDRVNYGPVVAFKRQKLSHVSETFWDRSSPSLQREFREFCEQNRSWLDDFSSFMAIKDSQEGKTWTRWPRRLALREPAALEEVRKTLADQIENHKLQQFFFHRQWAEVHSYAQELGIKIIGDIPIFVAHDSSDVWTRPEEYDLDQDGNPFTVAGVPPDYFSETGQRWGNPLYRWDQMRDEGFEWWKDRFRSVLSKVDVVRLDHFRGFEAYWAIPAAAPTAEEGRWVKAPGREFFQTLAAELDSLPIIAEDLGVITPEVEALRDEFDLPGMRVLQFAFASDGEDPFLPHNYPRKCVVYTGTHDNDTTVGWYESIPERERDACRRYLSSDGSHIAWDLIRAAWGSVANWAIAPMQDFLELGTEARMNYPGKPEGNWQWRLTEAELSEGLASRIQELNAIFGR